MKAGMRGLHFHLHGLTVSVETADADLRAFVQAQFEAEDGAACRPDVSIRATWRWGDAGQAASPSPGAGAQHHGRGVSLEAAGDGSVGARWSRVPGFPELKLSFALRGEAAPVLGVEADCTYSLRGLGHRLGYLRPGRADRKRNRLFFKLMYHMIYFPIAWHLQRSRGWGLLHASAVALSDGRAVVLSGMGGVGKSTLGLSLLSRPGARLVSDNLLFHDEERIYACPEPVRLDATALAGISEGGVEPERSALPSTAHPKPTYRVEESRRALAAVPSTVIFLRVAEEPGAGSIDTSDAAEMLRAGNDLAREIENYRPCASLLTMMAVERGGPSRVPAASLAKMLEGSRCMVFRIGRSESVPQTAARLGALVEEGR